MRIWNRKRWKMDNFKKYPSLLNVEYVNDIAWWLENYPDLRKETYIVREKIDGANLQIAFLPNGEMKVGRRTAWFVEGEKFYDYKSAMLRADSMLGDLKRVAQARQWPLRAYFELYGPGINRRVKYDNEKLDLALLDIAFIGEHNDTMWAYAQTQGWAIDSGHEAYLPPLIGEFRIDDAIGFDLNFNSKILGIECNQAEGIVIQPSSKCYYNGRGERFVLKAKHPNFGEMDKKSIWKPREPATPEQELFATYLNENRVLSVFSKYGKIDSIRQLGDYIKFVMEDAKEDFKREHPEIDCFDRDIFSLGGKKVVPLLKLHL
jgi:Rnl2 family RNA ligase